MVRVVWLLLLATATVVDAKPTVLDIQCDLDDEWVPSRDCPPRAYCVPIPQESGDDVGFCSCQHSEDLFGNASDGSGCVLTSGTWVLISITLAWVFVLGFCFVRGMWAIRYAYRQKMYRRDILNMGTICTSAISLLLCLNRTFRVFLYTTNTHSAQDFFLFAFVGSYALAALLGSSSMLFLATISHITLHETQKLIKRDMSRLANYIRVLAFAFGGMVIVALVGLAVYWRWDLIGLVIGAFGVTVAVLLHIVMSEAKKALGTQDSRHRRGSRSLQITTTITFIISICRVTSIGVFTSLLVSVAYYLIIAEGRENPDDGLLSEPYAVVTIISSSVILATTSLLNLIFIRALIQRVRGLNFRDASHGEVSHSGFHIPGLSARTVFSSFRSFKSNIALHTPKVRHTDPHKAPIPELSEEVEQDSDITAQSKANVPVIRTNTLSVKSDNMASAQWASTPKQPGRMKREMSKGSRGSCGSRVSDHMV